MNLQYNKKLVADEQFLKSQKGITKTGHTGMMKKYHS